MFPRPDEEKLNSSEFAHFETEEKKLLTQIATIKKTLADAKSASDAELKLALRDIAVKACADPESITMNDVQNLPPVFDSNFDRSLPGGLSTNCSRSLFLFMANDIAHGERISSSFVKKYANNFLHPPTPEPLPSSPSLEPVPAPIQLLPADRNWQARALYNLSWKACQPGAVVTQEDIDTLGPFPTGGPIPGAAALATGLSGCGRSMFDRILAANRPGTDLSAALVAQWAGEAQPRQPPPYHHRDPDDRPDPPPHPKHCIPRDPAHPDIPGSCEEGYHN